MTTQTRVEQVLSNKGDAIDERPMQGATADATNDASSSGENRENREDRIRRAAYAAAERRGFEPGFETDDWLDAERQLDGERDEQAAPGGAP